MSSKIDVIFDIETKNSIFERSMIDSGQMEISVVCAYRSDKDEIITFWEDDMNKLEALFNMSDRIIGFNSWKFDEPILDKYFSTNIKAFRSIDMLEAIKKTIGYRIKLDKIAQATLKTGKIGTGNDAVRYWKEGKLKELEKYCKQDVAVTRDLFYHGESTGKLAYFNGYGDVVQFDIDWSAAERLGDANKISQQSLL